MTALSDDRWGATYAASCSIDSARERHDSWRHVFVPYGNRAQLTVLGGPGACTGV
jgi:hypothetical protein